MDATKLGHAGLVGWRSRVGARLAEPVAQRTPLRAEQVRALVGMVFIGLSAAYLARALTRAARSRPPG